MATNVQAFFPTIIAARFLRELQDTYVWGGLANTLYSGSATGDDIVIPTNTTSITVGDYTINEDIADAQNVSGTGQTLDLNQQKFFHFLVDDIEAFRSNPDLMSDTMRKAAVAVGGEVDEHLMAEFYKARINGRTTNVTSALDSDAFGPDFLKALTATKRNMTVANLPLEGRWIVMHPDTLAAFETYLIVTGNRGVFTPATDESTLRNGFVGSILGFNVYVTTRVGDETVSSKNYWHNLCGQGNNAVSFAEQIAQIETYRPEKRFADAVKGLYVYGSLNVEGSGIFSVRTLKQA